MKGRGFKAFLTALLAALSAIFLLSANLISDTEDYSYKIIENVDLSIDDETLEFTENGELSMYQYAVTLSRGDAFLVSLDIDGRDQDGGLLFVDLYAPGYDNDVSEFRCSLAEGDYSVERILEFGNDHPKEAALRLFATGDTAADVRNITVERISFSRDYKGLSAIALAVAASGVMVLLGKKAKDRRTVVALWCGIVALQVLVMAYWAGQKSNLYVDELYSLGNAHKYTAVASDAGYIYNGWENGEATAGELRQRLMIGEGESVLDQSLSSNIRLFFMGRNYFWILNLIETLSGRNNISIYAPIFFNIFPFILTQILLYRLLRTLGVGIEYSLLGNLWYGFNGMTVSNVEYIRFYTLAGLFLILSVYLHALMWKSEKLWKWGLFEAIAFLCFYLGYKNTELMLPLAVSLGVLFLIGILISKRWEKALVYGIPMIVGGGWLIIAQTDFINMLLHSEEYISRAENFAGGGDVSRTDEMMYLISHFTTQTFCDRLLQCFNLIKIYMFRNNAVISLIIALLLGIAVWRLLTKTAIEKRSCDNKGFVWIICGIAVIFTVFNAIAMNIVLRYYSFICVLLVIVVVYALDRADMRQGSVLLGIALLGLIIGCTYIHISENVDYIYREDRGFHQAIEEYSGIDSLVVMTTPSFQRAVYEAVLDLDDGTVIRQLSLENGEVMVGGEPATDDTLPDKMLIWAFPDQDISEYLRWAEEMGYGYSVVGSGSAAEGYFLEKSMG